MCRTSARPRQGCGAFPATVLRRSHWSNIFPPMRIGALVALLCVAACRTRPLDRMAQKSDSLEFARIGPQDSTDGSLLAPRVVAEPSVVLFWLRAADTMAAEDRADTFDDLKYYTEQIAPALEAGGIKLLATNAETVYVALPNPTPVSVRDCSGCLIIPGLIQAHIHLCQTLFRGLADDLRLEDWLVRRIWPLEAAHTEETVYWSAMLGAAELLLGGTTAILDMETVRHTGAAFQALERIGIRAAVGECLMDAHPEAAPLELADSPDTALAEAGSLPQRRHNGPGCRALVP